MLYLTIKDKSKLVENFVVSWQRHQKKPPLLKGQSIVSLEATDEDHAMISVEFTGIPLARGHTRWKEPFAQFIYDNL